MFLACGRDRVVRPAAVLEPIDDRLQLRPNSQQPSLPQPDRVQRWGFYYYVRVFPARRVLTRTSERSTIIHPVIQYTQSAIRTDANRFL